MYYMVNVDQRYVPVFDGIPNNIEQPTLSRTLSIHASA